MKIYVVDNGGQWTHKEFRVLKSLGVNSEIIDNDIDFKAIKDADGWVLSGGAPSINDEIEKLGNISNLLEFTEKPVLGICIGAQFMALHSGGTTRKAEIPEFGKTRVSFFNTSGIFKELPGDIIVWENHNDEILSIGEEYIPCASSKNCKIQAFYSKDRRRFGVQFHPEVENTQFGKEMFKSFIDLCNKQI